jgi:hypothetical protein
VRVWENEIRAEIRTVTENRQAEEWRNQSLYVHGCEDGIVHDLLSG